MSQQRLPLAWVNFVSVEKLLISLKLILEDILSWVITTLVRNFNYCNRSHNISHLCPLLYSSVHLHLCSTLHYKIQRCRRRFNPWLFTHLTFCLEKDLVKLKIELTNNGAWFLWSKIKMTASNCFWKCWDRCCSISGQSLVKLLWI